MLTVRRSWSLGGTRRCEIGPGVRWVGWPPPTRSTRRAATVSKRPFSSTSSRASSSHSPSSCSTSPTGPHFCKAYNEAREKVANIYMYSFFLSFLLAGQGKLDNTEFQTITLVTKIEMFIYKISSSLFVMLSSDEHQSVILISRRFPPNLKSSVFLCRFSAYREFITNNHRAKISLYIFFVNYAFKQAHK